MLWIIVRIAALITALMSSASAEEGLASRYGRASGTQVACGGSLNENALTAAHRSPGDDPHAEGDGEDARPVAGNAKRSGPFSTEHGDLGTTAS